MRTYTSIMPEQDDVFENVDQSIKNHLKTVFSEDVYYKWIDNFVFEKTDSDRVTAWYYGSDSLRKFKKENNEILWIHICSAIGHVKKIKYCKKSTAKPLLKKTTRASRKNLKVAKLSILSLIFAGIAVAIVVIMGNYIGNRNFREVFYSVSSLKADNKIRIIQISDLHNSSFGKDNIKLISRVEKLKPDVILLTGDCLDSNDNSIANIVSLSKTLTKTAPTYYIYGNNEVERLYDVPLNQDALDKKFGFNDKNRKAEKLFEITDEFEKELETNGVKVLKNEIDTISVGTTNVDIYGVLTSNPSAFWSYGGNSFEKYIYNNPDNLKITAIHEPFVFEEFEVDTWGDVMIAGHTHGGVAKVPVLGPLYTHEGGLFPERGGDFVYGRYDVAGRPLIVSSGLTNKNIFRINNSPELVVIDINRF